MNRKRMLTIGIIALVLAVLGGRAISAQDKYTLQVPNGLAFSDFRGYEHWEVVAVSQTENLLKVMVANPVMIDAYRAGVPGNGKPFPDGSKIAKIESFLDVMLGLTLLQNQLMNKCLHEY